MGINITIKKLKKKKGVSHSVNPVVL